MMRPKIYTLPYIPRPKPRALTLREWHGCKDKVIVLRYAGGLGDILVHRMIFDGLSKFCEVHWAVPYEFKTAAADHPSVTEVHDCVKFPPFYRTWEGQFGQAYNTTHVCMFVENATAPHVLRNRADIWSLECGVLPDHYDMHLSADPEVGRKILARLRGNQTGPAVMICPYGVNDVRKLNDPALLAIFTHLRRRGAFFFGCHNKPMEVFEKYNVPWVDGLKFNEFSSLMAASDYVVAVDSGPFHLAAGMKKPLVGIFANADGKSYGMHYDFVLLQRHRDNGNWECGPCMNYELCWHPGKEKPCLTGLTASDYAEAVDAMFDRWPDGRVRKLTTTSTTL